MLIFNDVNGGRVELTFGENQFGMAARHVLVIFKHKGNGYLPTFSSGS